MRLSLCQSVGWLIGLSVRRSVCLSHVCFYGILQAVFASRPNHMGLMLLCLRPLPGHHCPCPHITAPDAGLLLFEILHNECYHCTFNTFIIKIIQALADAGEHRNDLMLPEHN